MMPLSKYKSLLGEEGQSMTEEELRASEEAVYQFAEMAFSMWMEQKTLGQQIPEFTNKM